MGTTKIIGRKSNMKKNIQTYSVYNVEPSEMESKLKKIKGLKFEKPFVNDNDFCEVRLINATAKQWQSIMRIY